MSAKTEKERKLFTKALAVKNGETPRADVTPAILKIVDSLSIEQLEDYVKPTDDVNEATTSASSGSFETPFGVTKRDMKQLEDLKENNKTMDITLQEIEKIVKTTLIREEVYSETPSSTGTKTYNQTGEGKGKDISSKNAKAQKTYSSNAGGATAKSTKESGKNSKKSNNDSMGKVVKNSKSNMKDAAVVDVNKNKLQNDDQRIEAHANGQEDIVYDNISDDQQKKISDNIKNEKALDNPNAQKTGVADQMIDDAKKRKSSKDSSKFRKAKVYGSDVEYIDGADDDKAKKIAVENTIKRLTFKESFKDSKDLLKKIPKKYKENSCVFEMYDGVNKYKIRWEGNKSTGTGIILEHVNSIQEEDDYNKYLYLSEYNTNSRNTKTSKLNEHDIFKNMINDARGLSNE